MAVQLKKQSGFEIEDQLYAGSRTKVLRGRRLADLRPVILKVLMTDPPSPTELDRFRCEYGLATEFQDQHIPKALDLIHWDGHWTIVWEDSSGRSLDTIIKATVGKTDVFLPLALKITEALTAVHDHGVIHKDICPANIIITPDFSQVQIIDFGIASKLSRELAFSMRLDAIEGTLAYMAPEQTGRMNRPIDLRSDLYSLGVTFYQLLTGSLPFTSMDPLEIVHCHIAKTPRSPAELCPGLPPLLSRIIMKLLAKEAEQRYQSTRGLAHDLTLCLDNANASAELGTREVASSFSIPARIYGREAAVAKLAKAFARAQDSQCMIATVTGPSGIGKSALVHELVRNSVASKGFLASGKFDQNVRNSPFLALTQALRPLVSGLLSLDNTKLEAWRLKIMKALGDNGQVIAELIPELTLIMGSFPAISPMSPLEAMNRLNIVFESFLRCFADPGHPLILFLDDLQWADGASLRLLEVLGSSTNAQSLLVVLAYRDEELDEGHPVQLTLNRLMEQEVQLTHIELKPIELEAITSLVGDTLHCESVTALPLARLIAKKSGGNPYFIVKLLQLLHERGTIKFDPMLSQFTYDADSLAGIPIADNVVEVVLVELNRLPDICRLALAHGALISSEFSLISLTRVLDLEGSQLGKILGPAINADVLIPLDPGYRLLATGESLIEVHFRFAHDRVQEASSRLLSEEELKKGQYRVGRFFAESEDPRLLIEATGHLFAAIDLLSEGERIDLAKLCLKAGDLVAKGAAFHPAYQAFDLGLRALGSRPWETDHPTALRLHVRLIEVAYYADRPEQLDNFFPALLKGAKTSDALDIIPAYKAMCRALSQSGRYHEAIRIGCQGLALLGERLDERPTSFRVLLETLRTMTVFNSRTIQTIAELPELRDPRQLLARELLSEIGLAASFVNKNLSALIIMGGVRQSFKFGMSEPAINGMASYALILAGIFKKYDRANAIMEVLIQTCRDRGYVTNHLRVSYFYHAILKTWTEIPRDGIQTLEQLEQSLVANGDLEFAGMTLVGIVIRKSMSENIQHILDSARSYYFTLKRYRQEQMALIYGIYCLFLSELAKKPSGIPLPAITDDVAWQKILDHQTDMVRNSYHGARCLFFSGMDRFEEAIREYARAAPFEWSNSYMGYVFIYNRLYASLALFASMTPTTYRRQAVLKFKSFLSQVKYLAKRSPVFYGFPHHFLKAELSRLRGREALALREYQEARRWAMESGVLSVQALSFERSGRYALSLGDHFSSLAFLRKARHLYAAYGSMAKVEMLEAEFKDLRSEEMSGTSTANITKTYTGLGEAFDFESICRACQAISSELTIESLIQSLAKITLEAAGARRGLILLKDGTGLVSYISATLSGEFHADLEQHKFENLDEALASSVVNYTVRSQTEVVLDDATQDPTFARDPYIVKTQCASIACVPIENHGDLVGVFYLENELSPGVFTTRRMKTVALIAAQGAISIRNVQHLVTAKEKIRLEDQMQAAQAVQNALLPPLEPIPGIAISAAYISAEETGGDWYGYHHEPAKERLYIQIGDVTGHGVPSALLTGAVFGAISSAYEMLPTGGEKNAEHCLEMIVRAANRAVTTAGARSGLWMTMAFLVIDLRTGEGLYHNAGHLPVFLRQGNKVETISARGNPLGLVEKVDIVRFTFNPGDILLLITDGLVENGRRSRVSARRHELKKLLEKAGDEEDLKHLILENYHQHLQDSRPEDDCSFLSLRRRNT